MEINYEGLTSAQILELLNAQKQNDTVEKSEDTPDESPVKEPVKESISTPKPVVNKQTTVQHKPKTIFDMSISEENNTSKLPEIKAAAKVASVTKNENLNAKDIYIKNIGTNSNIIPVVFIDIDSNYQYMLLLSDSDYGESGTCLQMSIDNVKASFLSEEAYHRFYTKNRTLHPASIANITSQNWKFWTIKKLYGDD